MMNRRRNLSCLLETILFMVVLWKKTEGVSLGQNCTTNDDCTSSILDSVCSSPDNLCECDNGFKETDADCTIVSCTIPNVTNATTNPQQSQINYDDNVVYTCLTGYESTGGNLTRKCQANETLTGDNPVCSIVSCNIPNVTNAMKNTQQAEINYDDNVVYTCLTGYESTGGSLTRRCQANKTLTGDNPVCSIVSCNIPDVTNAMKNTQQAQINYDNNIVYTCLTGYESTGGSLTRKCQANKTLTGDNPVCSIVSCNIPDVTNAMKNTQQSQINYDNNVVYTCLTGYESTGGSLTRKCQANKTLTGDNPICSIVSCNIPDVTNAMKNTQQSQINYDNNVVYTCLTGYESTGGSLTRKCQANKTLTGDNPICSIVSCNIPDVSNAMKNTQQSQINYDTNVVFTCLTGYESTGGSLTRKCQANKTLTGDNPICSIVSCNIPDVTNAMKNTQQSQINYDTNVVFTCLTGYESTGGSLTRKCQANKTLTGDNPVCSIVSCNIPDVTNAMKNTQQSQINYDTNVVFTCLTGYESTGGSLTRKCQANKTLTGDNPICSIVSCNIPDVTNAMKNTQQAQINYDNNVVYTCLTGYESTGGSLTRKCQANKTLTGDNPSCSIVSCNIPDVTNATKNPQQAQINYDNNVVYTCLTGYESTGGSLTRKCQANKTLTGDNPVCSIKKCKAEVFPNSSIDSGQREYDYKTNVIYTCNDGFSHTNGSLVRTCQDNKTWNGTSPTCSKIKLGDRGCVYTGGIYSCEDLNAMCDTSTECVCKTEYYDDNGATRLGTCKQKVGLDMICSTVVSDSCLDPSSSCQTSSSTCKCQSDYYDDNGENNNGGSCKQRHDVDASCERQGSSLLTDDQCKDQNARCNTTTLLCTCNVGYHTAEYGAYKICEANKALGNSCDPNTQGECSDPNAGCLLGSQSFNICTCNIGFYDDNGFTDGGNCNSMNDLKVSAIIFKDINTDRFTVSWTGQTGYLSHVSSYSVSWRPDGEESVNTGNTTTEVTNLQAGQKYTVTVTTVNSVTQVNSSRNVSQSKEQSSKPNRPGPLKISQSELNATDSKITLVWTKALGHVSKYNVKVLDGDTEKNVTSSSLPMTTVTFPDMKNGHIYDVSLTAESIPYAGGSTEISDAYLEQIKTVVMPPTVPKNFSCGIRKDVSIFLHWADPLYPNGKLSGYEIDIFFKIGPDTVNRTVVIQSPVNQYEIKELEPGTYYDFNIYTVNENFTSVKEAYTACKTLDKVSDPPSNLTVLNVTNRSMTISWNKPNNSYGKILGYVLQLRDESDNCQKEVFIKCCGDTIPNDLQRMCSEQSVVKDVSEEELKGKQEETIVELLPFFNYTISIAAVNEAGKGNIATHIKPTLEEAPVAPANVTVEEITKNSFTVKWGKGPVRPGITTYTVDAKTTMADLNKVFTVEGFDKEMAKVEGLEEYWNYSVKVTARTSIGSAESSMQETIRTLAAAPGRVANFRIITGDNGSTYQTLIVQWNIPDILERNSDITGYKISYNDTTENSTTDYLTVGTELSKTIAVKPERLYTVVVYAINHQNESGMQEIHTIKAPAGVPYNAFEEKGVEVIEKERVNEIGQKTVKLPIKLAFFEQNENGEVVEHGLTVYAKSKSLYTVEDSTSMKLSDFQNMANWRNASKEGFKQYRPTAKQWLVKLKNASSKKRAVVVEVVFKLGEEDCSSVPENEFCNGPLAPDTEYIVRLVVCTNGGCLLSRGYGPFHTQPVPPEASYVAAIAGGAAGGFVAALVVVAVVGFILYRRRRNSKDGKGTKPVKPTELHPGIQRKRPVTLEDFPQYLAGLHKDSNLLFSAEYEDLRTLSPSHPTKAADAEENRLKNRYINILPFDHTRVKLLQKTDDDSDFINANYLPGYKSPREYIGCQGPIPATLDDFWRMVWEQNVAVIVMLTLCKEGNKVKAEPYWPDEIGDPKQFGDIVVEMTNISNIKTYDYRIFKISYANCTRTVKQFHFLSWLDFQANITHDTILDFITQVRSHVQPPDTAGPMIVHCSAGVGRTGTYICLDYLMQFLDNHDFSAEVDIFDMVLKLRENRPHMVQTEQQYVFIHDCLTEMIERKKRALMEQDKIYVNEGFDQEENLYQNTEHLYQNVSVSGGMSLQNTEL